MDGDEVLWQHNWGNFSSSSSNKQTETVSSGNQSFAGFVSQQNQQKWEDPSILEHEMRIEPTFLDFGQMKAPGQKDDILQANKTQDWDPRAMLNNLSFMEQKIHQLQDLVHLIVAPRGQVLGQPNELVAQQQQLITADLTSIIVQLISTAGSLLPSVKNFSASRNGGQQPGQLSGVLFSCGRDPNNIGSQMQNNGGMQDPDFSKLIDLTNEKEDHVVEDHDLKDEEDGEEGESLPPGSYEILQLEKEEILAPHTHFCTICGKGFKRDANLRMHMRGHGDEYKTPAALAKPNKESGSEPVLAKRFSCPFSGCKRNKDHKKFQPLKTILCVKNHYKRTHCDKSFACSRCHAKKFSVIADLKTHEKHCGKIKWLCSCGTTFSRKDKLFGHIALFQGHTPAIPLEETKAIAGSFGQRESGEGMNKAGKMTLDFASNASTSSSGVQSNILDVKGSMDDSTSCFSPLNFDTCNFGGFHQFPRPTFDDSESSFSLILSGACNNFFPKN